MVLTLYVHMNVENRDNLYPTDVAGYDLHSMYDGATSHNMNVHDQPYQPTCRTNTTIDRAFTGQLSD